MRNFILGVITGTLLTAIGVQAAGRDGLPGSGRSPLLNDEGERQFQLQLEQMRKQTELEQVRIQAKKKPC